MTSILRIAWRSIWRNRRRTLISMAAVCFGLVLIIFYSSLLSGILSDAKNQLDNTGMGHVEIAATGWRAQRDVRQAIRDPEGILRQLDLPPKSETGARLLGRGLATSARGGEGVEIHGVDWAAESALSVHSRSIVAGERPADGDLRGILIGDKLAKRLKVGVGGRLRVVTQGADGEVAANLFRVRGIFTSPSSGIALRRVLVGRDAAAALFGVENAAHQLVIQLDRAADSEAVADRLRSTLGPEYEVVTYGDLLPALRNIEALTDKVFWFAAVFVYMLVGLGILNTMLMSVMERTREFGVLRAVGTRPGRVVAQVLGESFWIATISAAAGLAIGLAITWYGSTHALLDMRGSMGEAYEFGGAVLGSTFRTEFSVAAALRAASLVYVMALLTGLYPAWRVAGMPPAEALHAS